MGEGGWVLGRDRIRSKHGIVFRFLSFSLFVTLHKAPVMRAAIFFTTISIFVYAPSNCSFTVLECQLLTLLVYASSNFSSTVLGTNC